MASMPSPSPSEPGRIVVTPRGLGGLGSLRARPVAAARATATARQLGVAATDRDPGADPVVAALPEGVRGGEDRTESGLPAGLDPALARYAAALRRRRQRAADEPLPRGLPLMVHRGATSTLGPDTGPGGLARSARGESHAVAPVEARTERDPMEVLRAATAGQATASTPASPATARPTAPRARGPRGGR